ncbi:MAG TPA: hypothetical protein VE961_27370 [Pyrinomonadaceae bacterium]|nr:hypothetical protein [Pyrinomonadaceae bacterium]
MTHDVRIREQYLDYKPPVIVYGSLELLLRHVPDEHLAELRSITLTNSAALLKSWPGKYPVEKRRVRPADCRGLYGNGKIVLVVDQMFSDCPEFLILFPPVKTYLVARTLYHEIGHHIHRLEQPGYRADRETFADEWRDKLIGNFMRQRYWYFGLLVRGLFKLFPSLTHRGDAPPPDSASQIAEREPPERAA